MKFSMNFFLAFLSAMRVVQSMIIEDIECRRRRRLTPFSFRALCPSPKRHRNRNVNKNKKKESSPSQPAPKLKQKSINLLENHFQPFAYFLFWKNESPSYAHKNPSPIGSIHSAKEFDISTNSPP